MKTLVVSLGVSIACVGVFYLIANNATGVNWMPMVGGASQRDDIINLPRVNTTIWDENGTPLNVEVDTAVLVGESDVARQSIDLMHMVVADMMNSMDYSFIEGLSDTVALASHLQEGLEAYLPGAEIRQVLITDMQSGAERIVRPEDATASDTLRAVERLWPSLGN